MTGSINKIYFAREAGTVGPIKIGCSCGPEARLKQIEFDYRIKDGVRCHRDTCAIADLLRPILPALVALVAEADRIKGAA